MGKGKGGSPKSLSLPTCIDGWKQDIVVLVCEETKRA